MAQRYLSDCAVPKVDTLILGCTHYPIISAIISKAMGDQVTLIDSGRETAVYAARLLKDQQLLASGGQEGRKRFMSATAWTASIRSRIFFSAEK